MGDKSSLGKRESLMRFELVNSSQRISVMFGFSFSIITAREQSGMYWATHGVAILCRGCAAEMLSECPADMQMTVSLLLGKGLHCGRRCGQR